MILQYYEKSGVNNMRILVLSMSLLLPILLIIVMSIKNKSASLESGLRVQRSVYLFEVLASCFVLKTVISGISGSGWWLFTSQMTDETIFQTYFLSFTLYQLFIYIWSKQRTSVIVDSYESYLHFLNLVSIGLQNNHLDLINRAQETMALASMEMTLNDVKVMFDAISSELHNSHRDDKRLNYLITVQQENCRHRIETENLEWNQSLLLWLLK